MKKNILKIFTLGIVMTLVLVSNSEFKGESTNFNTLTLFSMANAQNEVNYSSGYIDDPQPCTVTTYHTCTISVCYGAWCCTVGFNYTLESEGTRNYCKFTGNPASGCTWHECRANG